MLSLVIVNFYSYSADESDVSENEVAKDRRIAISGNV